MMNLTYPRTIYRLSVIGVTDESNDSFLSQEVSVRNDLPTGDSDDLPKFDSDFENGIEDSVYFSFRESVREFILRSNSILPPATDKRGSSSEPLQLTELVPPSALPVSDSPDIAVIP